MKKKLISFVLALAIILPCMFALTACGSAFKEDVAYKIDSKEIVWNKDVTDAQKTEALGGDTEDELVLISEGTKTIRFILEEGKMRYYNVDSNGKEIEGTSSIIGYYKVDGDVLRVYDYADCRGENMEFYSEDGKFFTEDELYVYSETYEKIVYGYVRSYIVEA